MTAAFLYGNFLDLDLLGTPMRAWLEALAVFAVTWFVLGAAKKLALLRLTKLAEHAEQSASEFDALLLDLLRRTHRFFLATLGVYFAHHWLTLSDHADRYVENLIWLAICIQAGLWGLGLVHFGIDRMTRGRTADDPARTMGVSVLGFIGRIGVWAVALLTFLQAIGQPVGPLLTSLGVGGIAVALALQNVLSDLFASITILLDKPFVVGDSIQIGDLNGTIEKLGVKSTRLRSVSGEEIIIGNQDLVTSRVRNFKRMHERRQVFPIGITYDTTQPKIERVAGLMKEIVSSVPETRFDRAHLKSLGASALEFEVVYYVLKPEYAALMDVQHRINIEIYKRFAAEGIEFAFPTQTLRHVTEPPLGSRAQPQPPGGQPQPPGGQPQPPGGQPQPPGGQKELSRG